MSVEPTLLYVEEEAVPTRERNRSAGYSYGASTLEMHYTAHYSDGTTAESWHLHPSWAPFVRPWNPHKPTTPEENPGQ